MLRIAVIALLAQTAVLAQVQPGSIEGVVVRAGTTTPLSRTVVEVRSGGDSAPPVYTTTDGKFLLRNVRPGRYQLVAIRSGYVRRSLAVTVAEGQATGGVLVPMTPTGAISGRISDDNGEPLGNVEVQALKAAYQLGRRVLMPVQSVRTNDLGEYRLFWLAAGKYFVAAIHPRAMVLTPNRLGTVPASFSGSFVERFNYGGPSGLNFVRATGGDPHDPRFAAVYSPPSTTFDAANAQTDRYIPLYYPGTIDDRTASAIDLQAGADVGGIDIRVAPVRARRVRGVVVNGATGEVAALAGLKVDPSDSGISISAIDATAKIDPNGSFDLALLPGPHTLVGTAGTGVGYVALEVGDVDIDNVTIVAMPAFTIPGRIIIEGRLGDNPDLGQLRASLRRDPDIPGASSSSYSIPFPNGAFNVEGTAGDFRVNLAPILNLTPGAPFLTVSRSLEGAYVKSIRLGDVDVLNGALHLEGPPKGQLEIVIGTNAGSLDGTVLNEMQEPAAGVSVVLLPDARHRTELYKTSTTDPSGRFQFDRLPPGDYKLFAWEDLDEGAWQDPEFIRVYENRGTPIRIGEGSQETVRLIVIALQ